MDAALIRQVAATQESTIEYEGDGMTKAIFAAERYVNGWLTVSVVQYIFDVGQQRRAETLELAGR